MGSLFYLIAVGLIGSWIIAVFFGVGLFFLIPRSAKLTPGLSPGGRLPSRLNRWAMPLPR
jgi:hypothetical protein